MSYASFNLSTHKNLTRTKAKCIISLAVKPKYNFYKKIDMQKAACGSKIFDALIEF